MLHGNRYIWFLAVLILPLFLANLLVGTVNIPLAEVFHILLGNEAAKESRRFIVWESRLPQALTATLSGASLAACGLMLQTAFRNPLAGTSVLGVNAGASLGVALVMLLFGGTLTAGSFSLTGFVAVLAGAFGGAMGVMALILALSTLIRGSLMLLIAGIMVGYLTSSLISLLNFFATDEGVQSYMVWGLGNFGGVSLQQMPAFAMVSLIGLCGSLMLMKPLNALLLGERYAENLGVSVRRVRHGLLAVTGLLTAVTTAFCDSISFIDLAVPHIARLLLGTANHRILLPATMLSGAAIALLCNLLCQLSGEAGIIPLNVVTPMLGAPVIIYVIMKQRV